MSDPVITLGGIELPGDLSWPDRYTWNAVAVSSEYSLTGALIIQSSTKLAGRPITLEGADNRAWATRDQVTAIQALQAVAGEEYTLIVRGETYTVMIIAVSATPLWDVADDSDPVALKIEMITM